MEKALIEETTKEITKKIYYVNEMLTKLKRYGGISSRELENSDKKRINDLLKDIKEILKEAQEKTNWELKIEK